jgi:hypothetical protein
VQILSRLSEVVVQKTLELSKVSSQVSARKEVSVVLA